MFGGVFGRDRVTCDGNDGLSIGVEVIAKTIVLASAGVADCLGSEKMSSLRSCTSLSSVEINL